MRKWTLISILVLGWLILSAKLADGIEVQIENIDEDGRLINPLKASVEVVDPENTTITWFLDEKEIGTGPNIQRYVYPGDHNLTVVIEYLNGTIITKSFSIDPVPPPGWEEEPDNTRNRIIFWVIFGSGGLIFAAFAGWIWLKKDESGSGDIEAGRIKIQ